MLISWCATLIKDNYNEKLMEAGMVLVSDEFNKLPALLKYRPPLDGRWKQRSCDWDVGDTPLRMDLELNAIDCSSPLLICVYATKTIPL